MSSALVVHSECRAWLATLAPNSLDSCVTDPPYELNFMGRDWDRSGIANQVELWRAVYRVLKPGAHLVAFGGTRTAHRMVCAIEDAGFEIRDSLHWLYGSGFPKSHDVSKALDKAAGAERAVVGSMAERDSRYASPRRNAVHGGGIKSDIAPPITAPATDLAAQWAGWGTALKPAHEPICLARKPVAKTVAATIAAYGTGGINVEACRVKVSPADAQAMARCNTPQSGQHKAHDTGFNGRWNGADDLDTSAGRWPPNVLLTHSAACKLVGTRRIRGNPVTYVRSTDVGNNVYGDGMGKRSAGDVTYGYSDVDRTETIPAWECAPDCPVAALDGQSGQSSPSARKTRKGGPSGVPQVYGTFNQNGMPHMGFSDTGGASRFYPILNYDPAYDDPFLYCAKASRKERNAGCTGLPRRQGTLQGEFQDNRPHTREGYEYHRAPMSNHHPTVKPVALCRWLVRLVTPVGGTALDPFAGSGSVGVACVLEGRGYAGCDQDAEYVEIANHRIAATQPALLGV